MTHRRRILLLTVIAALAALAGGFGFLWTRTAITPANAAKLEVGMTRADVCVILGGPARQEFEGIFAPDFITGGHAETSARLAAVTKATSLGAEGWYTDRFAIWVAFDNAERVIAVASCPAQRFEESFVDKVRRRLHL